MRAQATLAPWPGLLAAGRHGAITRCMHVPGLAVDVSTLSAMGDLSAAPAAFRTASGLRNPAGVN